MVSCIEIETASLVFACLSLFSSSMGSLVCIALMVHMNVLVAYLLSTAQKKVDTIPDFKLGVSYYGLYMNVALAVLLAIVIVTLVFTIILTKGLLTKKAHLVKAYFIYGVTVNTISVLSAVSSILAFNMAVGFFSLLGCFVYCLILIMIKRTYHKLASLGYDRFGKKKVEVKTIA